jgi:pimeloyl-ACP methyl ester carboxylesterase
MATFVLVHGAFTGGWYWSRVRPHLEAAGHRVFTPTLTGSGERVHLQARTVTLATHVEDVCNALRFEDLRDVVLVGHSYGGMVITGVADRAPERLARVVYFDAAYPAPGQNATGGFADGTAAALDDLAAAASMLPPLPLAAYGVTDPGDVAWVGDRRVPHAMATLQEALRPTRATPPALPRVYVRCLRREGLVALFGVDPLQPMFDRAVADGLPVVTVDAGHDAMVAAPRATAEALVAALSAGDGERHAAG